MSADLHQQLQSALGTAFTIERELGGGGMSRVFVANDNALARRVVVKVLPPEMAAAVNAERFRREIQLAASLQHPHIVPVLSAGEALDGELLYYTMPFVEGESLRSMLARHRELAINEAIRLLREIADALAYAHDRGIVHRDIKPENILLTTGHALVADFGIARALSAATGLGSAGLGSLTSVGVAVGTPAYMAPEQAAADPFTDHRADLYALGVLAYELLAGHPPFHGLAPQQLMAAHAMTQPEHVTTRRPAVPEALGALVMQLLEKRPADRPQSAQDVMRALDDAAVAPRTQSAPAVTPTARATTASRRRRALALGGGIVGLAIAGIAAYTLRPTAAPTSLDANLIAVAPFRVTGDPSLAYLREGMLDLLSTRLTGEGGPRAGDPRTLLSGWKRKAGSGDADLAERDAVALAEELGAGKLLLGSVVATPPRIVLSASIIQVRGGARTTADVEGPADSLSVLVDRLAAELLARSAGEAERLSDATARTALPVLRLYLDGMANSRLGKYPEAQRSLNRALELDSTFIPAALALINIQGYHPIDDSRPWELVMRAHARLSEHDRALIEGRRRFLNGYSYASIREASTRYTTLAPDRAEAWVDLGDDLYYFGRLSGLVDALDRARAAFTRAVELDPDFAPAVRGLVRVAIDQGDTATVRARWRQYESRASDALEFETLRWRVAHALADSATIAQMRANLTTLPPRDLLRILEAMMVSGVGLPDGPAIVRELASRAVDAYDIDRGQLAASSFLMNGGRDVTTLPARFRRETPPIWAHVDNVIHGLQWDGDTVAAAASARALIPYVNGPVDTDDLPRTAAGCGAATWYLMRGDSAAAVSLLRRARELYAANPPSDDRGHYEICFLAPEALLERARGNANPTALIRLDSLLDEGYEGTQIAKLVAARLFEARGDVPSALAALRRRSNHGRDGPVALTTLLREEGRLAALAGDTSGAIRAYRHFLALRPDPAPRLRADTDRVRAALAELESRARLTR